MFQVLAGDLRLCRSVIAAILVCAVPLASSGEPVVVRQAEGVSHGFLRLRDEHGAVLASGESTQRSTGGVITSRMRFRFRDGSTYDEQTAFSQRRQFRLISDHVVQRGPAFPGDQDVLIDMATGTVTVRYTEKGESKVAKEQMTLPDDLANGLMPTLLKNVRADALPHSFAYVAASPKPRLIKLRPKVAGDERFTIGALVRTATHFVVSVELGGVAGVVAPILGKQPPDSHVWIAGGDAPGFVRAQQPFFADGPLWTIELAAPTWDGAGSGAPRSR